MRLDEIEPSDADEARVKRLKDNAASAKDRAMQLKAQADTSAARLATLKAQKPRAPLQNSATARGIKPQR